MQRKIVTQIEQIAFHRNGISGAGFHAIRFVGKTGGVGDETTAHFLATVFDAPGHVAVICLDTLAEEGVGPAWRGDNFEPELRAAIQAEQDKLTAAETMRAARQVSQRLARKQRGY